MTMKMACTTERGDALAERADIAANRKPLLAADDREHERKHRR